MFGEFAGRAKRAINFISRDLDETLDTVPSCAIEQHARADDICVNEIERIVDAAVHVRFSREIDDSIELMLGHERVHLIGVRDIGFEKLVAFAMFFDHAIQIGEVARVSEDVDVSHVRGLVML